MKKQLLFPLTVVYFGLLQSALVSAHTPYLVPSAFEPVNGGLVTLDASFAEKFFRPEVVFDGSEFEVYLPNGKVEKPETVINLASRNVVEQDLVEDGTYRFSTGRRLGRVFKTYELNGENHRMENVDEPLPDGAEVVDWYQSNTMAETYVTRGGPTDNVLRARGDGIEYLALTNPNDLFSGEALEMQTLYYGDVVSDVTVEVYLASSEYAKDDHPLVTLTSDKDGYFSFTPEDPGVYLLRTRYRAKAPEGSLAPEFSHTYTLTVEAF